MSISDTMPETETTETTPDPAKLLQEFLNMNNIILTPLPQFMARDDGTFSLVVRISVDVKKP